MKKGILLWAVIGALAVQGQATIQVTNPPATLIEQAKSAPDAPLVRGISVAQGANGLFMEVRAEKVTNLETSKTALGISLRGLVSNYKAVDYVDYDELDPMIRSLQYISQATHSVSSMDDFEVSFHTRGGFTVNKTSSGSQVTIIVHSGRDEAQRVEIDGATLDELTQAVILAKNKLDARR